METHVKRLSERDAVSVFDRVVVGVDSSPESLEAVRQAATLAEGPISLVSAYDLAAGLAGGVAPAVPAHYDDAPHREAAERWLDEARKAIPGVEVTTQVYRGRPWDSLLAEIGSKDASLVAVGSHGTGRALGIVIGSTATELIHKARCSVLVTRSSLGSFPSRIVVGLDGSEESLAAYEVAETLAARFQARLEPIVASLEDGIEPEEIGKLVGRRVRSIFNYPVDALVSASANADLLVVGSRGLRGLKALGSVSERVAHEAASSVLIVRRQ